MCPRPSGKSLFSPRLLLFTVAISALAGCGDASSARMLLRADDASPAELDEARVTVAHLGRSRVFTREDGVATNAPGWRTPEFEVSSFGRMTVRVLFPPGEAPSFEGRVRITLREGFRWNIDVFRRAGSLTDDCFGCIGAAAFRIPPDARNEPDERLWIVWGGHEKGTDLVR